MNNLGLTTHWGDCVISVEHPSNGAARSRRVVTRSGARWRGKYPSWKVGRMLHWESQHELNAFRLLDADASVAHFAEQPFVIHYRLGGVSHDHYPDLLVERIDAQREVWEVKTARDAARPEVSLRTALMRRDLPALGYTYRLVVAEDLGRQPRLDACLRLLRLGQRPVGFAQRERVMRLIAQDGPIRWGVAAQAALGAEASQVLARLALEGAITVDLESGLRDGTPFFAGAQSMGRHANAIQ